jgi:hypothetical protein
MKGEQKRQNAKSGNVSGDGLAKGLAFGLAKLGLEYLANSV